MNLLEIGTSLHGILGTPEAACTVHEKNKMGFLFILSPLLRISRVGPRRDPRQIVRQFTRLPLGWSNPVQPAPPITFEAQTKPVPR